MKPLTTPRGRPYLLFGDPAVVTLDRVAPLEQRLDSDPRVASVSVVAHANPGQEFLRATAPAGRAVLVATDVESLAGRVPESGDGPDLLQWARNASDRGLWHDWWLTSARDVSQADVFLPPADLDLLEVQDLSTSRYGALAPQGQVAEALSITVDATWLGPHQTGAQVLTTAALDVLSRSPRVSALHLVGIAELPEYARHLSEGDSLRIGKADAPTDVVWYPNQIDQRVDITYARSLGRRVITTYLDLIAYDIPRYHASPEAWAAYRALQRRIALSVDGITTISADVAARLQQEVPRLDPSRLQPIPLGLDHIHTATSEHGEDISHVVRDLGSRPFVLVLGNDFMHKNRDFALQVWEKVLAEGTNCDLVLAGLHVKSSSSRAAEEAVLAQHTNLRGTAHTLGHVSSESREWLMANAGAVLYPSSAEGFGFVPYEAAALGTPSTFAAFGPLAEIAQITDVPQGWSTEGFAADLARLLQDPEYAQQRVAALRAAIARSTWANFGDRLLDFMHHITALPPVEAALVGGTAADASALAAVLSSKTWRATEPLRRVGRRFRGRN